MSSSHSWKPSAVTSMIPGGKLPWIFANSFPRRFDANAMIPRYSKNHDACGCHKGVELVQQAGGQSGIATRKV